VLPVLRRQHQGQQVGTSPATRDRMQGAGCWLIASQQRQETFSCTCSTTFQRRGSHSSYCVR
jgi:hypothetical protein